VEKFNHTLASGKSFVLDLPQLQDIANTMEISGLSDINIPFLRSVGELDVGATEVAFRRSTRPTCRSCLLTYLSVFSAPSLEFVERDMTFEKSPGLWNISLPLLRSVGNININNTRAVDVRKGIEIPQLTRAKDVQIVGARPYCEVFDTLQRSGVITGNYSCQSTGRELGSSDRMEGYQMFRLDCYQSSKKECVSGDAGRVKFVVEAMLGLLLLFAACFIYAMVRSRQRRKIEKRNLD
jgi:hypothetical protein